MPGLPILRTYVPHCSIFGRFASMRLPTYVRMHLCTYVRKAYVRTYVRMYCFAYVRTYVMDCGADPVSLTCGERASVGESITIISIITIIIVLRRFWSSHFVF